MKKKSKKIVVPVMVIVIVLALIVFILYRNRAQNAAETAVVSQTNAFVAVEVDTAKTATLSIGYRSNGTFAPNKILELSAEQSGRVAKVLVDKGEFVKVGQPLVTIKADELSVSLENAIAVFETKKADYERFENAFKTGGVTAQQVAQARLDMENADKQLKQAKIGLGDATIRATINGVVNKRSVEPGTVVSPGTQLFELIDMSRLKYQTTVNELQVTTLKIGDTIAITASAIPNLEFHGIISFVSTKAESALNFPVEMEVIDFKGTPLRAGMFGTAHFESSKSGVITVSRKAFVGSLSSQEVFVVRPDSTVHLTKVVPGLVADQMVEVIEGLKEGDVVVINGQINLQDGTKVAVAN